MKDEMKELTKLVSIRNTGLPTKDETCNDSLEL